MRKQSYLCKNFPKMKYLCGLNIITSISRNVVNEKKVEKIQSNHYSTCYGEFTGNMKYLRLKFIIGFHSKKK